MSKTGICEYNISNSYVIILYVLKMRKSGSRTPKVDGLIV